MNNLLASDFVRIRKNKLLLGFAVFAALVAVGLMLMIRSDIRLGISVFGGATMFRDAEDAIRFGVQYYKSLGILIAVVITIFIGQEYSWNTWQQKWIVSKSRMKIYFAKLISSVIISIAFFVLFQVLVLALSGSRGEALETHILWMLIGGVFVYAALGSALCAITFLFRNQTTASIVGLIYVLFSESLAGLVLNLTSQHSGVAEVGSWLVRHTIFGMITALPQPGLTPLGLFMIAANATAIAALTTVIGVIVFRSQEL
jgi:ABC-type transport system involved in multi-copper enzyme maturation permease subunit